MASCSTLKASSSAYNYHVFLSFRGADTRNTFTGHLYANLVAHGIHTFRDDDELEKGGQIASNLWRAIEESKIFIIIFSKGFADSKWCLNEVVKIIDCMKKRESVVLPVFYHMEPRDVRNQGGSFEKAFLEHAKDADQEKEKTIETWKEALKTAGELKGYDVKNKSEAELIQNIREDIITRLNRKPLHVGDNIVGMDSHLEQLKLWIKTELDEVHVVGIYGTGGIGKTTIAMAIYNDISSQFDGSSFLRNVGGKCEDGLLKLQKTLLQDILKCERPNFSNTSEGINVIKDRLQSKRVLIVLDDVDSKKQLECFAGKYGWYGAKSIIITTTRDKHLLVEYEVDADYEVQKLNHENSTELFNWCAFKQSTPKPEFESLPDRVVKYADGLPIALRVLGGFLFKKSPKQWKSELEKLETIPNRTVQSVLKVSYDKLDYIEQRIFLDIACFFIGEDKDFLSRILGSYAEIGIKVLNDSCLITILENKLDMHDLIQQMGQEIIRQECLQDPGKRSRLWDPIDVNSVLTNNTGTKAIEGLSIQIFKLNQMQFTTKAFKRMNRLRLLKVYDKHGNTVHLPRDFEFPSSISYLRFDGYSLESLPKKFHGKNLIEFDLISSSIKQLWEGNEILNNLKAINLSYSRDLVEIPDFGSMPNLEILNLEGCISLQSLPRNFHKLEHLRSLCCKYCSKLKSFPEIKGNMSKLREINLSGTAIIEVPSSIEHLNGLETLNVQGCSNLKGFPEMKDDMKNLVELYLGKTVIEELPYSIGHLKALKLLDLSNCKNLKSIPESICNLSSLEALNVWGCSNLKGFPEIKHDMENLDTLYLGGVALEKLPYSIGHLKALKFLDLSYCKNLVSLPKSICNLSSLETLNLRGCSNIKDILEIKDDIENLVKPDLIGTGIEEFPYSIGHLKALKFLDLSFCENLVSLPEGICNLNALQALKVSHCSNLKGFLEIKDNMENLVELDWSFTGIKELPYSIRHLKALKLLDLSVCKNFVSIPESIYNLSSLEILNMGGCSNLKVFPEIRDGMENLVKLDLIGTGIEELPYSVGYLKALKFLDLSFCKNLVNLSECIFSLNSLRTLRASRCSNLKGFPEIKDDMENLVQLDLSFTSIEELPYSIGHLKALKLLILSYCNNFVSLRESICNLRSLEFLNVEGCSNLKDFPEIKDNMENLESLDLSGTAIEELPSSIGHLKALQSLDLSHCKNLVSFPESICNLSSLERLKVENCPKLERLEVKPEFSWDLTCYILKQGVIWGNDRFSSLKTLNLQCNQMEPGVLNHHIFPLSSLVELSIRNSRGMEERGILNDSFQLSSLGVLSVGNFNPMARGILSDIFHQSSLKRLSLDNCNLMEVGIPSDIWNLSSLEELYLSNCNLTEGDILNHIFRLSSLKKLHLAGNPFSSIPASIIQLSKLRTLNLSHCQKLLQIPELPPSLRFLDVHACPCLETLSSPSSSLGFSLFRCFKSAIEEFECESNMRPEITIVIPGNKGIPEWISQQQKRSDITIELPKDWHQDNDFLGFALYSVYVPLDIESKEDPCSSKCELNFHGHQFEFRSMDGLSSEFWPVDEIPLRNSFSCCRNGGESNRVWVEYYPKVAIKKEYWSNEWRHLKASFHGEQVKVEECGFHLIYMPKIVNRTAPQDTNIKGVKHNHAAMIQYLDVQRSCGTKSVLEAVNAQRSCDDTQSTDHGHSPMVTITQNIDDNVVDAQDDEEDHMHKWLELLCKLFQWICCRR